jgi:NAD(P)-dependent dehydrogenase (short-subunit alcohol dehydrogenase family)
VSENVLFDLSGRVAVVTGATGLLGRHHVRALAEAGASVVVTDVDEARCRALAEEVSRETGRPGAMLGHVADVTEKASVEGLLRATLGRFGRVDVLVNNAAVNDMFENPLAGAELSKFENYPLELWKRSLDVNVTGTFLCAQVIGAEMARAGRGSIVNIGSTYGITAPDQAIYKRPDGSQTFYKSAAYPATKGAVISLTRFIAAYWGKAGVRCNAISPGGVENGQEAYFLENYAARTPLGRMSRPTELAGALVFLASDASSYVTGSNLVVDGGWTAW